MNFDDFMDIVNVLGNPDAYAKKIAELKSYEQSIKNNIDASVDVSKLKTLLSAAAKSVDDAEQIKAKAVKDAEKIVADASVVYNARYAKLASYELSAANSIAEGNRIVADQSSREAGYREQEKSLVMQAQSLANDNLAIAGLQAELTERLNKLRSVMG